MPARLGSLPERQGSVRQVRNAGYAPGLTGGKNIATVTMPPQQERWAVALFVQRTRGEQAPDYVAERIEALTLAGDDAGVGCWREVARHLDELRQPATVQ